MTPPQRLRTALARALVTEPELLILDAPLRTLDPRSREECRDDLRQVHAEAGVTTMVLTDDPDEAMAMADVLAVMDLGRIVQFGPAHELYSRPADVFVARLLGPTNLLQGQVDSRPSDLRGEMIVRTPLGRLIARSGPGVPGQGTPVTISVRPETLTASSTVPAGWNRFPATVERIVFRGELRQIHARGPGDWPVLISVLQSQSQGIREGQSLTLSVAPEHVVVLPGKFALGNGIARAGGRRAGLTSTPQSQDDVTLDRRGRRRPPAAVEPAIQQFLRRGSMIPDGDRHHRAQSARLEHGVDVIRDPDDHVVVKFILDRPRRRTRPGALVPSPSSTHPSTSRADVIPRAVRQSACMGTPGGDPATRASARGTTSLRRLDDSRPLQVQMAMTTLPKWAPLSRYLRASTAWSNGKTRSTTGLQLAGLDGLEHRLEHAARADEDPLEPDVFHQERDRVEFAAAPSGRRSGRCTRLT